MKKIFLCLLLLFSLFSTLAAQELVNEQYELFTWEPVAKAKQYGVTIEKYDAAQDIWTDYKEIKTKDTQVEVLFTPGVYRVEIASYNIMGRKSKGSGWVQFKILEEHIPYLNDRAFAKNSDWDIPVLFLNKSLAPSAFTLPEGNFINYISPDELFGPNAILVKGRNIFSPRTEFYLVPKEQAGTKDYVNWCDDRKEQKLNILYRNSKEYQVLVSYEPAKLESGYYALEVRNPGNNNAAIDILVLDNKAMQISPNKGFEIDSHYSVNSISLSKAADYEFSINAKGLNSAASLYFEPALGSFSYPFETAIDRQTVPVQVTGTFKQGASSAQITCSFQSGALRTGYYNLVAKNWDGSTSKFLCLIKKDFDNDYTKNIKKLKTKFNKKTEYVDVTIQDIKLDEGKKYTLVSEYDEVTDSNKRVSLNLSPSGKKLVGKLTPDQLDIAKYALMIEDAATANVIYCEIDNTLKISQNKMNDTAVEKTFLRPAGKSTEVTLNTDDTGSVKFFDSDVQMIKRMPPLFSNMRFDLSLLEDNSIVIDLDFDILNFNFVALSLGSEFRIGGNTTEIAAYSLLKFIIPSNYFSPYLGLGIGENLLFPQNGIKSFNDGLAMFTNKNEAYGIAQLGVVLFTVIDVHYNLFFNGMLSNAPYFTESLSFGFSFPLRSYKFKRKVLTRYAQISKPGELQAAAFIEADSNVDTVELLDSTSVGGFEGYNNLVKVTIDKSVEVIEENAFRDCKNLNTVTFNSPFVQDKSLVIKSGAFKDDNQIDVIYLPERTSVIESGAFAGWTSGQNIILEWSKNDEKDRDLTGLLNTNASVHYSDGELFRATFATPLEDGRNWVKLNELEVSNVSIYQDQRYLLGMRVKGWGFKWYRVELDSWINQESPQVVLDYLKSGSKLVLKVQGDGNKYDFILTTQDGGYFYYRFKTEEDGLTTIEIPYKKMKKYSYSSQKKLDIDNIKMFCIMPMCKDEWNEASFFDFEVTQ